MSGKRGGELAYLALGDSYTIGEGVGEAERWPKRLAAELRRRGHPLADPRIVATTGWTTDELARAMDEARLQPAWDLVSLLIGVNNQYRGRSLENFRHEYGELLERAIELADGRAGRVFVLSIPDWAVTPFGRDSGRDQAEQSRQLAAYNDAKREISEYRGVAFFDITPSTLAMGEDPELVVDDGLHPSGTLYERWVERIVDAVEALLGDEG